MDGIGPLLVLLAGCYFLMGVGVGIWLERRDWNDLIAKGIIHRPKKVNK